MKDNRMKLAYEQQAKTSQEEVQRRLDAVFNVLFEEIFAAEERSTNRQLNHLVQFSPTEVSIHDR